jgi:hypothetical protein
LNWILRKDTQLKDQPFVAELALPATLRRSIAKGSSAPGSLLRLNRALLETFYSDEIASIKKNAFEVVIQPVGGFVGSAIANLTTRLSQHDGVVLYKIHGSFVSPEPPDGFPPVVITEEDYIEFLTVVGKREGGIPPLVQKSMASCNLLFLGYGLEDWDFRTLHKALIKPVPPNKKRESWAIQSNPPEHWVRFWDENGVFIYDIDIHDFAEELEQRCKIYDPAE